MNVEDLKNELESEYLALYRLPKVNNENNILMKRDLDAYLQKNPLM